MIEIFLAQEKRFSRKGYVFKYVYLFDTINSEVWIINPETRYNKKTDNTTMIELYYKDDHRERVHKNLFNWIE